MQFQNWISSSAERRNTSSIEHHLFGGGANGTIHLVAFFDYGEYSPFIKKHLAEINKSITLHFAEFSHIENLEERLEQTLKKINVVIPALFSEYGTSWSRHINAIIIAYDLSEIIIAHVGSLSAFLIRGSSITPITGATETAQPLKLFSHLTAGNITQKDHIFLSTKAVFDHVSLENIRQAISRSPDAILAIRHYLEPHVHDINFACAHINLSINNESDSDEFAVPHTKSTDTESKEFTEQEDNTGIYELISPENEVQNNYKKNDETTELITKKTEETTINDNSTDNTRDFDDEFERSYSRPERRGPSYFSILLARAKSLIQKPSASRYKENRNRTTTSFSQARKHSSESIDIKAILIKGFMAIVGGIGMIFLMIIGRPKAFAKFDQIVSKQLSYFYSLRRVEKIILIFALIIFLVTTNSLVLIGQNKISFESTGTMSETYSDVENKLMSAEASLIYNDYYNALIFLDSAAGTLSSIRPSTKTSEGKHQEYTNRLNAAYAKARQITSIDTPQLVVDLEKQYPAIQGIDHIVITDTNELLAFDTTKNEFYDVITNEGKSTAYTTNGIGTISDITQDKTDAIILTSDKSLYTISKNDKKIQPAKINLHGDATRLISATIFGDNLYLLDNAIGQIYKHTKLASRYGNAIRWVQVDSTKIREATTLGVDGSIYTLSSAGDFTAFFKGEEKGSLPLRVSPPVTSASKLFVMPDDDIIYIKDGDRVLKMNKSGGLITQYQFPSLKGIQSIDISKDGTTMFIAHNKQIYRVPLK